jgi:hypothetical protein
MIGLLLSLLETQSKKKKTLCSGGSLGELWVGDFMLKKRRILTYIGVELETKNLVGETNSRL